MPLPAGRKIRGRHGGGRVAGGTLFGTWLSAQAYQVGDCVSRSGVIYRCILDHTNQAPPNATYWTAETSSGGSYTDENAQDAVGGIVADTATLQLDYDDGAPSVSGVVVGIKESGGTSLACGAVADGQVLRRAGNSIVGAYIAVAVGLSGPMLDLLGAAVPCGAIAVQGGTVA